ncbi:MAG: SEL1-like repeat protein [Synergistaceae bacterium]|nr:SEL1-like repeat protein [Synergistaceae bacterium]
MFYFKRLLNFLLVAGLVCGLALITAGLLRNNGFLLMGGVLWFIISVSRFIPKPKRPESGEERKKRIHLEREEQERLRKEAVIKSWDIPKQVIAAQQGDAQAQYLLGRAYLEGIGVEQDPQKGLYWLEQASEQGHQETYKYLKYLDTRQDKIINENLIQSLREIIAKKRNRELADIIANKINESH